MMMRYVVGMIIACFLSLVVGGVAFTAWWGNRSSSQICGVINAQIGVYDEAPPTTETGKRLAIEYRELKTRFDC